MRRRLSAATWVVAVFLLLMREACAGSFQLEPLRLHFDRAGDIQSVRVRNTGAEPLVLQVEAFAWQQSDNADDYRQTRTLLATPPIITIAPDEDQIIRVALRDPPQGPNESAFRIYFHEVPQAPPGSFRGLQMALRVGIPVFVSPPNLALAARPVWHAQRETKGGIVLSVSNPGNAHFHIRELQVSDDDGAQLLQEGPIYVLPGRTHHWNIEAKRAQQLRVNAPSNVSAAAFALPVEAP
jgi:fimbrial chaperone protein